jgi:hypothetical protein
MSIHVLTFFIETDDEVPHISSKKRRSQDSGDNKLKCNLCNKKKASSMMRCTKCEQWQHFKCAGYAFREAIT